MKKFLVIAMVLAAMSCQSPVYEYNEKTQSWDKSATDTPTTVTIYIK